MATHARLQATQLANYAHERSSVIRQNSADSSEILPNTWRDYAHCGALPEKFNCPTRLCNLR